MGRRGPANGKSVEQDEEEHGAAFISKSRKSIPAAVRPVG
jgi:hypothetical protein